MAEDTTVQRKKPKLDSIIRSLAKKGFSLFVKVVDKYAPDRLLLFALNFLDNRVPNRLISFAIRSVEKLAPRRLRSTAIAAADEYVPKSQNKVPYSEINIKQAKVSLWM